MNKNPQGHVQKKNIKNRIKKQKIALSRSIKRVTMFLALQCAATIPQAGNHLLGSKPDDSKNSNDNTEMLAAVNSINIEKEIKDRAAWAVQENFIPAAKNHLETVKSKKTTKEKQKYVKDEFFDKVYPKGGRPGSDNYCIAALMRCMLDANEKVGDFSEFIPDTQTLEGHSNISCPRFLAYVQKNFPDCISKFQKKINVDELQPGDILVVSSSQNTSSGLHAKMYAGDGMEISFNRDYMKEIGNNNAGYVIKTSQIAEQCIERNLEGLEKTEALAKLSKGRVNKGTLQISPMMIAKARELKGINTI